MAKKKVKPKSEFQKKYPEEYDGLKAGDEVVYKRISDGVVSIGSIRYFRLGDIVYSIVIDLLLGNFQTARVDEINRNPTKKLMRSLWAKAESTASRRSSRRAKTKKM